MGMFQSNTLGLYLQDLSSFFISLSKYTNVDEYISTLSVWAWCP